MNTVLKAQAFSLHTGIIQLYTVPQWQWALITIYKKSTLQKFKNPKYQKGTVEETGRNLAASNCDREVAACLSLNMETGKYQGFKAVVCALSWSGKENVNTGCQRSMFKNI